MADEGSSQVTFGTYYVRPGCEAEFEAVIPRSWAVLRSLEFVVDEQPTLYRGVNDPTVYLEQVRWLPDVMGPAHEHPDVIPIWVRLADLVQPRALEPADSGLTFAEFVPVDVRETR